MKIIKNTSLYDTKKLQSLFCLVHSQLAKYEGGLPHWKSLKIQVMDKVKGRHASGCAYVGKVYGNRPDMWLSLNKETSLERIAQLFAHELLHSYGYRHSQFRTDPLEPHHIDEIKRKFAKDDLLSPKAFHVPQKCSYKQKCNDLVRQYRWLSIEPMSPRIYGHWMLELWDERCNYEDAYDWRSEDLRCSSWKSAYETALELTSEVIQKEYTENWTTNLNQEWWSENDR